MKRMIEEMELETGFEPARSVKARCLQNIRSGQLSYSSINCASRSRTYDGGVKVPCLTAWRWRIIKTLDQPEYQPREKQKGTNADGCEKNTNVDEKMEFLEFRESQNLNSNGAANETRTRNNLLGGQVLYQLNYSCIKYLIKTLYILLMEEQNEKSSCEVDVES